MDNHQAAPVAAAFVKIDELAPLIRQLHIGESLPYGGPNAIEIDIR